MTTPIIVLVLGIFVQRSLKQIEQAQWSSRKIIEKRISVYDETTPLLNDILCYMIYIGNWKELTPRQMLDCKRKLDKSMHLAAPLFSKMWIEKYNEFIHLCFKTYTGMGQDAKLRTSLEQRREFSRELWKDEWNELFSKETACSLPKDIIMAYDELMTCFSNELGLINKI